VIGFLDLVFPQHGVVIDLKTTGRMPSTMSAEHQLQRAIYQKAKGGNQSVKFLYVTPKKAAMLEDGDPTEILAQAKVQITRMEAFLRTLDKETAKAIVPVQPNSFLLEGQRTVAQRILRPVGCKSAPGGSRHPTSQHGQDDKDQNYVST
jgi:hypothetical protein